MDSTQSSAHTDMYKVEHVYYKLFEINRLNSDLHKIIVDARKIYGSEIIIAK